VNLYDFVCKHAGQTGWVVGKGRTSYDYADLRNVDGPVFFINDAVALESHLRLEQDSYLTFLDPVMAVWLTKPVRSVIICPRDERLGKKIFASNRVASFVPSPYLDTKRNPRQLGLHRRLGTICTTIHFAWFCGIHKLKLIGCDGFNDKKEPAYDSRIESVSEGRPAWKYDAIRKAQE